MYIFSFGQKKKIRSHQIDFVINAELPDPTVTSELYDIDKTHMVRGPCGSAEFLKSPRIKDGQCTKRYPKSFTSETTTSDDGYSNYRRLNPEYGGFTCEICSRNETLKQ